MVLPSKATGESQSRVWWGKREREEDDMKPFGKVEAVVVERLAILMWFKDY